MWEFLEAVENSAFSTWVREAPTVLAYSTVLALHTFGMAFLVGLSGMMALRALGFGRSLPIEPLVKFFPLVIAGFWVNAITGVVLTMLAAVSLFRNPDFYVKLAAIAGAIVALRKLHAGLFGPGATLDPDGRAPRATRRIAVIMLLLWGVAVTAGRLTAYSNFVRVRTVVAVVVAIALIVVLRPLVARLFGPSEQPLPSHSPSQT
jgi:hypothetical protein